MAKIAFLGDVSFTGEYCINNGFDYKKSFEKLKVHLADCDYIVANLESPFADNLLENENKSICIRAHSVNIDILNYLNVNIVNLSNNHILDFGKAGLDLTIDLLESNNIEWFGVYNKSLYKEDVFTAFHGYCSYDTNPSYLQNRTYSEKGLNLLHCEKVYSDLRKSSDSGYFNVISIHSGQENVNLPSAFDRLFAKKLSEDFNYFYYGHHPHVLQGWEEIESNFVCYSLGNFCFSDLIDNRTNQQLVTQSDNNKESMIVILNLENGSIKSKELLPFSLKSGVLTLPDSLVYSKINSYNEYFKLSFDDYNSVRELQLKEMSINRKKNRNLKWLLSRLSLSTVNRLIKNKKNSRHYKEYYIDFLSEDKND